MFNKKDKNAVYSFRKYSFGLCSVAIALFYLGTGAIVSADETANDNVTTNVVASSNDSANTTSNDSTNTTASSDSSNVAAVSADSSSDTTSDSSSNSSSDTAKENNVSEETVNSDQLTLKDATATTGVVIIQDVDISSQTALSTTQREYDFSKNDTPTTFTVTADADKYRKEGYTFDYVVNATTGEQTKEDKTITVAPNTKQVFARIYRYVGSNTGDKDTIVKTDNSLEKDVYFVGALDSNGNALERFAVRGGGQGDPYLETGSIYEINGVLVWCYEPTKPVFGGAKYEAKIIDEHTKNALINNFGVGYEKYTKADYLLADIEQGMMWEADGITHLFDKVQINRNNSGRLTNLTDDEKKSIDEFKASIAKAIEVYNSSEKADLVYNGIHLSDATDEDSVIELEEGDASKDSVELTGNAEMLHYYKNGAIKTPDGTILTIDDVKGIAKLDKLSSLKAGEYVLKMSMIRDVVQGDTTEWTHNGHQGMHDYRIKNPKWETIRIRVNPKPITEVPNNPPTVPDKPSLEIGIPTNPPTVPDKPSLEIGIPTNPPTVPDKPSLEIGIPNNPPTVPDKPSLEIGIPTNPPTVPDKPSLEIGIPTNPPTVPDKPSLEIGIPTNPPTVPDKPAYPIPIKDIPRNEVPKNEVPKNEVPKNEVPKNEVPKNEVPKNEVPVRTTSFSRVEDRHGLPETGESNSKAAGLIGLASLALGIVGLKKYKNKKEN